MHRLRQRVERATSRSLLIVDGLIAAPALVGAGAPIVTAWRYGWPLEAFIWSSTAVILLLAAALIIGWRCYARAARLAYDAGRADERRRVETAVREAKAEASAMRRSRDDA